MADEKQEEFPTELRIDTKDSRTVEVRGVAKKCNLVYSSTSDSKNELDSFTVDGYTVNKGQVISFGKGSKKYVFRANYIYVNRHTFNPNTKTTVFSYNLLYEKANKSNTYLLPLVATEPSSDRARNFHRYFYEYINTYVQCYDEPCDNKHLYLLYRYSPSRDFYDFDKYMKSRDDVVAVTSPDTYHIIYKVAIPEEYNGAIELFIAGKYSSFSKAHKKLIRLFHGLKDKSKISLILERSPVYKRELEEELGVKIPDGVDLSSVPNLKEETYNERLEVKLKTSSHAT